MDKPAVCSFCGEYTLNPITCPYCGGVFCKKHGQLQRHNCPSINKNSNTKIDNPATTEEKTTSNFRKRSLSSKELKILSIVALISISALIGSWVLANFKGQTIGYDEGNHKGYSEGKTNASIVGYTLGFTEGNLTEYLPNYQQGYNLGYNQGNYTGYISGLADGNTTGFENGKKVGLKEGYDIGYQEYYPLGKYEGNITGYNHSYLQGLEDIKNCSYNLTNPTYSEMLQFLAKDRTDRIRYDPDSFVCHDYSAMIKTNAFYAGYLCYYVSINPQPESSIPIFAFFSHAIVAFNTTDRGMIFVEPQHDDVVDLVIGESYSKLNNYVSPVFDDTIIDYELIR